MQNPFKRTGLDPIDQQINAVVTEMEHVGVNDDKYPKLMEHLLKLNEAKTKNRRNPVSLDTVLLVAGNLLLGVIVVVYENKHVVTSKAWPSPFRPKDLP